MREPTLGFDFIETLSCMVVPPQRADEVIPDWQIIFI